MSEKLKTLFKSKQIKLFLNEKLIIVFSFDSSSFCTTKLV